MAPKKTGPTKAELDNQRNANLRSLVIEAALDQVGDDKRLVDRRLAAAAGREQVFQEGLHQTLASIFKKGYATPKGYKGKRTRNAKYITNLVLSDLHYRTVIDPRECPKPYDAHEEARRTGKIAHQVAEYKRHHRDKSRLIIHLLGDIIQGQLHDMRDGDPLAMQFSGALHYLTQLVWYLASEFQQVDVHCTPGNHGRNKMRHHDRAVHQKWDSIETMLYVALKAAVTQAKNMQHVKVHIPFQPYYTWEAFDKKGFATHGDTVLNVGMPGKVIRTEDLTKQVQKFNTARDLPGPFSLFMVGHVHTGSTIHLPGDVVFVSNGCLVPSDSYALSIGQPDVTCGQQLFESVAGHMHGDARFITVDDADNDPGYEDIIAPFDKTL